MAYEELVSLLAEEAEIVEDDTDDIESVVDRIKHTKLVKDLDSAVKKITTHRTDFTPAERKAVRFAMEDLGELYRFSGSSSGFHHDSGEEAEAESEKAFGDKALEQAKTLGLV